jgi:hypothetical protein
MKTLLLSFAAATLCALATAQPAKILYTQAHGEPAASPQMKPLVEKLHGEWVVSDRPIDAAALADVRLTIVRVPSKQIAADEKAALIAHVRGGGALLVILDEERRQPLATTGLNEIIAPFGLTLTADTPYLHNQGALAKAGVIHRADCELPFSGGRAVEGGTPFAWQLDAEGKPAQPFAAYRELENGGRVIVLAEGMAAAFLGRPEGVRLSGVPRDATRTVYWGKDSAIFMEEVLGWLLAKRTPTS